jgi:hypothetical protein
MTEKPDPTQVPEFKKVIRHFVTTPHKPHVPLRADNGLSNKVAGKISKKRNKKGSP